MRVGKNGFQLWLHEARACARLHLVTESGKLQVGRSTGINNHTETNALLSNLSFATLQIPNKKVSSLYVILPCLKTQVLS